MWRHIQKEREPIDGKHFCKNFEMSFVVRMRQQDHEWNNKDSIKNMNDAFLVQ